MDKLFTAIFAGKSKRQGFGLTVIKRKSVFLGRTLTFDSEEENHS
jgi:hypothetical protein